MKKTYPSHHTLHPLIGLNIVMFPITFLAVVTFVCASFLSFPLLVGGVTRVEFDCTARKLAFGVAARRLAGQVNVSSALQDVHDALRLSADCNETLLPAPSSVARKPPPTIPLSDDESVFYAKPGELASALKAARDSTNPRTIVLKPGWYALNKTLQLSARDSGTRFAAEVPGTVVISGAVDFSIKASETNSITKARVPQRAASAMALYKRPATLSARDAIRLPWAREPNGNAERDLQPTGYAAAAGPFGPSRPDKEGATPLAWTRLRNSSVYPDFGKDLDPRDLDAQGNIVGWQWLHAGGDASRYGDNRNFFNGTVPSGMYFNATPSKDRSGNAVSGFNATLWTDARGYKDAIVHVFHNAFWGNWFFQLKNVSGADRTILFGRGGWQESHGGGVGTNPFYVEGVKEALDAPNEWFIDRQALDIYLMPNASEATFKAEGTLYSAPVLDCLIDIDGASEISFEGIEFAFSAPTFLKDYIVPSPGDWAIHRGGAVSVQRSDGITFDRCSFVRLNGNAIYVGPGANGTRIENCEFSLIGDSAIATVGDFDGFNGAATSAYPDRTTIVGSHFHEIGVTGKQSSALFSALTARTNFSGNVLYNGPRAGINLNDAFYFGHEISDNLIFNWVRETQDHGPINTWNRAAFLQKGSDGKPTTTPQWTHISRNFIMNGPSGNRDLGNLFPAIDNDDGSAYQSIVDNVLVYGGGKNYLGNDKRWLRNLIIFPERWSGDPCAQLWGGEMHFFVNNTCVTNSSEPLGLDGTSKGFKCRIDWQDGDNLKRVAYAASNTYFMSGPWSLYCGNATSDSHLFTLAEMQEHGRSLGTSVRAVADLSVEALAKMVTAKLDA